MMGLNEASLPATLGSIRLVMIRAFVTQTSRVQDLKSKNSNSGEVHTSEEIARLDDQIKPVVQHVDSLVADASPHLVVGRLEHAFKILEELWPRDFEEASKTHQPVPGDLSNDLAEEKDTTLANKLIPRNCPQSLRKILSQMLLDQKTPPVTLAALSVKDWEASQRPSVKEQFINVPTLAQALQIFSQKLYRRSTIAAERTKEAIEQFQDVIGTIQLCHLIIITQLDAPYEWYCTSTEGHRKKSAAISILPSCLSGTSAWSRVLAWQLGLGAATIVGLTGGFAVLYAGTTFVNLFLNKHKEYLNLSFPGALGITLQALGLPLSDSEPIVEKTLLECVYQDIPTSRTPETLEKWKNRLAEGLKKYPGAETNQWSITPTYFWPQWLFSIAKIAQFRVHLHGKICIGVQGSTEGGKSQMLTVLTGAAEDYFKPGSDSRCRTLGIQSYDSDRLGAVFIDCPGFDDQTPQIKYMAETVQELFAVIILIIPMERTRSEAMESALNIAIKLLRNREDSRPIRILLSKADRLEHNRNNKQVFRNTLADVKEQFMHVLKSELGDEFTTFRQQPFHDGVIRKSETLEDIVKPFSTHAQMSLEDTKALADCPPGTECKIERASHFENLCELADKGELWDVQSLRAWLWNLSPESVPLPKERVREYF
jgi:GTP-binding protein EngB required for normal cell division